MALPKYSGIEFEYPKQVYKEMYTRRSSLENPINFMNNIQSPHMWSPQRSLSKTENISSLPNFHQKYDPLSKKQDRFVADLKPTIRTSNPRQLSILSENYFSSKMNTAGELKYNSKHIRR